MVEDIVSNYWVGKESSNSSCSNVSLFRFLGGLKFNFKGKKVLEVGYGGNNGADLLEAQKRGAIVYGTDINPNYIDKIKFIEKSKVFLLRAGLDPLPFNSELDLIYSRDVIYYLDDDQIKFFLSDCYKAIKEKSMIVIQIIEKDFNIEKKDPKNSFDDYFFENSKDGRIFEKDNPIRFLSSRFIINSAETIGFKLIGVKRLIQSYDIYETNFRVDRYFAFIK
ncbi:MAG: hypothetical protein CFH01_00737 [Alphaproteobacteria bacterium MarineAlpha2_Bin1]|nr:MAG: hypothetical protein CFH01_00737 [Alphaproteobacteria bacterium MarineAlpha2_Bin1]|tara:strand:+ start:231 stop:896 length:666 start_codon:yes stop_codon:yes gene_type:complete